MVSTQRTRAQWRHLSSEKSKRLSTDETKAARERRVFLRFVERCQLSIDSGTVESRSAATNEPDIRCVDSTTGKPRAFELVQLTDERMMKNLGAQSWHGGWVGDPTEAIYRKKAARLTRPTARSSF